MSNIPASDHKMIKRELTDSESQAQIPKQTILQLMDGLTNIMFTKLKSHFEKKGDVMVLRETTLAQYLPFIYCSCRAFTMIQDYRYNI